MKDKIKYLARRELILGLALTFAWMLQSLYAPNSFIKATYSIPFLILVPGYYLYRAIVGYSRQAEPIRVITYSVGLSIVYLMALGLSLNTIYRIANILHPLTIAPLTLSIGSTTALLAAATALHSKPLQKPKHVDYKKFWSGNILLLALGALLPFMAAGGAVVLNNGGPGWLALATIGSIGFYFLMIIWKKEMTSTLYSYALFAMTLAILLATSLRGWNITGHDIMQEYQVFQLTLEHMTWNMKFYQDAYNACLSITILPTILHQLTGISPPYVYKFIFQVFFAFITPTIYITLCKYVPKKVALIAAFTFLTFPAFLTDITMLNRQETALLLFALAIQAALDDGISKTKRNCLSFIFLVGMIFSHYSTSYIAVAILMLALVLGVIIVNARIFRASNITLHPTIFTWRLVLPTLAVLVLWNGIITHTSSNITTNISSALSNVVKLIHGHPMSGGSLNTTNESTFKQYIDSSFSTRPFPAKEYYRDAANPQYRVAQKQESLAPEQPLLRSAHIPQSLLTSGYNLTRQGYGVLTELLIAAGLVLLTAFIYKRNLKIPAQYALLGISTFLIITAQVAFPPLLLNYGLTRVILEGLIILALPATVTGFWLLTKIHLPATWRPRVIAIALIFFYFILSGAATSLTGGFKPALALSNSGFYYEAYYTHNQEIVATKWLVNHTPVGSRVYADEFMRRKIIAYSDSHIYPRSVLLPEEIPIDSYVVLSVGNTKFNEIPVYHQGVLIFHTIPYAFLNTHKNIVYSSDGVVIYK